MILLVGLGNPGPRYADTRHNVGFRALDWIVDRALGGPWRSKFQGHVAEARIAGERCLALKPMTFMNESGRSVRAAASFFRIDPKSLVVVHDELDLPFGQLRLKFGGGDAGHRGLASIRSHLGTGDYARLRVGIDRMSPNFGGSGADYVLEAFPLAQRAELDTVLGRCSEAIELLVQHGVSQAMNSVNRRTSS